MAWQHEDIFTAYYAQHHLTSSFNGLMGVFAGTPGYGLNFEKANKGKCLIIILRFFCVIENVHLLCKYVAVFPMGARRLYKKCKSQV